MNRRDFLVNSLKVSALGYLGLPLGGRHALCPPSAADFQPSVSRTTFHGCSLPLLGVSLMNLPPVYPLSGFNEQLAEQALEASFEQGVTAIDTASTYHDGAELPLLGKLLTSRPRNSYLLNSKLFLKPLQSQADATQQLERQLIQSKTSYFDFFMLQMLDAAQLDRVKSLNLPELMNTWKRQGKIRFAGFSFADTPEILLQALDLGTWDFVQLTVNAADWHTCRIRELHQILQRRHLPIIAVDALRGGDLEGFTPTLTRQYPAYDPSWAYRFTASQPGVLMTICQPASLPQLHQAITAFAPHRHLTESQQNQLLNATQTALARGTLHSCGNCSCATPNPWVDTRTAATCPAEAEPLNWNGTYRWTHYNLNIFLHGGVDNGGDKPCRTLAQVESPSRALSVAENQERLRLFFRAYHTYENVNVDRHEGKSNILYLDGHVAAMGKAAMAAETTLDGKRGNQAIFMGGHRP